MRTGRQRRRRRCNGANEFEHQSRKRERLKKKKRERPREKERERERGRRTPKKSGRWVVRMSGLSEWMTDRQQPDRRLTARRRADSLPLCRAFATSSITDYRTCWSLSHSSTKSERTPPDFVLSRLTGSMIIFEREREQESPAFTLLLPILLATLVLANFHSPFPLPFSFASFFGSLLFLRSFLPRTAILIRWFLFRLLSTVVALANFLLYWPISIYKLFTSDFISVQLDYGFLFGENSKTPRIHLVFKSTFPALFDEWNSFLPVF